MHVGSFDFPGLVAPWSHYMLPKGRLPNLQGFTVHELYRKRTGIRRNRLNPHGLSVRNLYKWRNGGQSTAAVQLGMRISSQWLCPVVGSGFTCP
jgi:hypothetical protein